MKTQIEFWILNFYYNNEHLYDYIYIYCDKYETESYNYEGDDVMKYINKYKEKNNIDEVKIWDRNNHKYLEQ